MKHHWIDSSILQTFDKQHPTTTGIFEVFGKKTNLNVSELKELLIDWMCDKRTELSNCMAIAWNQSKQTFTEWLQRITLNEDFIPDELTIYCLCRFLHVHTLVYTSNFCWSTLINQFKYNDDELYNKTDIRLVYVGHHMFAELKHIRQPKPPPMPATTTTSPDTNKTRKRTASGKHGKKVTNRGDRPRSKHSRKLTTPPSLPPPPTPQPSQRSRRNIDYLQLNDGLEELVVTSPKSRKRKPHSPPPRAGPSASRQAASQSKRNKIDLEQLMENTPDDGNKLPDLVMNQEPSETFNAVTNDQGIAVPDLVVNQEFSETLNAITNDQTTTSPDVEATGQSDNELKGITDTPLAKPKMSVTPKNVESPTETNTPVTPENTELTPDNTNDTNESNTPAPVGHDTATTDKEEAVEALLAWSNLLDIDDEGNDSNDNATLMPIDGPSRSIDVNPVKVKLSTDDISQAIEQLPVENRLQAATQATHADADITKRRFDLNVSSNCSNKMD